MGPLDAAPTAAPFPPPPRPTALRGHVAWLRGAAVLGIFVAPNLILALGFLIGEQTRLLKAEGRPTQAEVFDGEVTYSRRSRTYWISYEYFVEGRRFEGRKSVSQEEYERLEEDDTATVKVTYLPRDPSVHCLGSPSDQLSNLNIGAMVVAALAGVGCLVWWVLLEARVRKETRLAAEGVGASAKVVDKGSHGAGRHRVYWIKVRYHDEAGRVHDGTANLPWASWEQCYLGRDTAVLFDPHSPSSHLPLFAFKYVVPLAPPGATEAGASATHATLAALDAPLPSDAVAARPADHVAGGRVALDTAKYFRNR